MLQLRVGAHDFLLTPEQLGVIMGAVKGCEVMSEKHVGTDNGTQGYSNSYVPLVYTPKNLPEVLKCQPVEQDLIDTIKLTMTLNSYKP